MPQSFEWSDAYSVGHAALDDEHRALMRIIRKIAEAGDEQTRVRPLLCDLKQRTAAHFAHESMILREIVASTSSGRPNQKFLAAMGQALLEEHFLDHDRAKDVLESMIRATLADHGRAAASLGETLIHWFVNHAVRHDAHLKTLFQTIRAECPGLLARG